MDIKCKKLSQTATMPTQGSTDAAGYDLYADIDAPVSVNPGVTEKIPTNISMAIPKGYFGGIYARSGLSIKNGLRPANCVGVIDSDYRGNVIVALHNDSDTPFVVDPGMRIAQIIIQKHESVSFIETDTLDDTTRGEGGFGSTGTK